ncbi:unnamed protein product [Rotaria sp. Silwood1]|nr:unnamed protein product [Rotaria sp. Silwood1]
MRDKIIDSDWNIIVLPFKGLSTKIKSNTIRTCIRSQLIENYATRWIKPHLRTPGYLYGKIDTLERCCGLHSNPEYFAYDNTDSTTHKQPLYRVRFNQEHIWDHYEGSVDDTIDVEIYEH